jgi:regulator of sigma E protease
MTILFGILGLALLMVVHEAGHYLAARAFKMRVTRFSIGFGPAVFRHTPKGSPTTYQIAIIPFLAYVQIAGMNPLEEVDPKDEGSYANASLFGRISTIVAGPLANYLFASVLFFGALLIGGLQVPTTKVAVVQPNMPAEVGQVKAGDKVVEVAGQEITAWEQMRTVIGANPNKPIDIGVERDGKVVHLHVTPAVAPGGEGRIGIEAAYVSRPATMGEAMTYAVQRPAEVVADTMLGLVQMITGKTKADLAGPVGIVRETARAAKGGLAPFFSILGLISAYLGAFNLLPIPALDGGRLMFLAYEATTRRRPDPKVEAQVHAVGLVMMLALVLVVTFVIDIPGRNH